MSKIEIWLIRHGETTANIGVWSNEPHHVLLTDKGFLEAKKVAEEIIVEPHLLITSSSSRAKESALPIVQKWPHVCQETWPIEEFVYLAPSQYEHHTIVERKAAIKHYWEEPNPLYCDGEGAESFAHFIERVYQFHQRLLKRKGFIVVVGHGQFFKAFLFGLIHGFTVTAEWMRHFRAAETERVIHNGEIIKLQL